MTAPSVDDLPSLPARIAELDEGGALELVRERAGRGESVLNIIEDCQRGMRYVGDHYASGTYFISGLIMAGEIFREAMEILSPLLPDADHAGGAGTLLLCTVQGDIHDLGKSIVDMLLRSYGFAVHDLGVDVAPADVARAARELGPDMVGLSGLLTQAAAGMRDTVAALHRLGDEQGRHIPVIIGGGLVTAQLCEATGADLWADDASRGVRIIRETIAAGRH